AGHGRSIVERVRTLMAQRLGHAFASVRVPPASQAASLLRMRGPTTSTLFPYTTLFRSTFLRSSARSGCRCCSGRISPGWRCWPRSEEHTAELQSLTNVVCRLLLEKKKGRTPFPCSPLSPALPDSVRRAPLALRPFSERY